MKKFILVFSLLVLSGGGWWLFGSPGESPTVQAKEKWQKHRLQDLEIQKEFVSALKERGLHFTSLELIHVGPGEKYFSWWGHLMVRFVGSGDKPQDDVVLSFLADFNDFPLDKAKGLFGGYTVLPKLQPLSAYYNEYVEKHHRSFERYQLNSSEEQRKKMKEVLFQWLDHPELAGTYSFAYNNCVGLVHKYLKSSDFAIEGFPSYWPSSTIDFYHQLGLIPNLKYSLGLKGVAAL